jgi:hypothetical protein
MREEEEVEEEKKKKDDKEKMMGGYEKDLPFALKGESGRKGSVKGRDSGEGGTNCE